MQKIKMPIELFNTGSVIDIDFPFEDDSNKSKKRPAIVIDYNNSATRVILLKVTTHQPRTIYDYLLQNPALANLSNKSVVRCNHICTLSNGFKCEKRGDLSRQDCMTVQLLYNQAVIANEITEVQY